MDTGAIGRSQTPPKSEANVASQQHSGATADSVHVAAGKSVLPTEPDQSGPSFDDTSSPAREKPDFERSQTTIDRRTIIDPETETYLYQLVEERTGDVKLQIPDDVLLNVREYTRGVDKQTVKQHDDEATNTE
ncbi:MAG: hypothetical protein KDJ77_02655 [Rhodobiaceae bacterium]|nr:hypothetical protein [Rhodobiaceae bacterium]